MPSSQSVNPKLMLPSAEPMRNSKIITAEGNKLCPDKPAQKKTDISTWKISKYDAFIIDSLFQLLSIDVLIVLLNFINI